MEKSIIDVLWVTGCAGLVFIMQAGFLCLESGLTRSKNSINVAIKNLVDLGISVALFWLVGFGLMFGATRAGWIGTNLFLPSVGQTGSWMAAFFLLEAMFCATAATIVSGAAAERLKFASYILVTALVATVLYPIFGHWAWGGTYDGAPGWLSKLGFRDFAGSTVVHSLGGWVALASLLIVGSRAGRFPAHGKPQAIQGSNLPLAVLGVLFFILGWFGFNGGSTLAANGKVPGIIANTILSGAGGMITTLALGWMFRKSPSVFLPMFGMLAGLVAITASSHAVTASSAMLIGSVGGIVMLLTEQLLERLRIDDAVGAVPVHLGAGIWGTLAVALFGNPDILASGLGRWQQLGVQCLGVIVCFAWTFGVSFLLLKVINTMVPLRVTPEDEDVGLNVSEHGARTELTSLLDEMDQHARDKNARTRVTVEPFTEAGRIAVQYNRVMEALQHSHDALEARVNERTLQLSAANEEMRRLVRGIESAGESIIITDPDGVITYVNPAFTALTGYDASDAIGRKPSISGSGRQPVGFYKKMWDTILRGEVWAGEVTNQRKNGSVYEADLTIAPVFSDDGRMEGFVGVQSDITERRRHEESVEASLKEKEVLLKEIHHRVKNNLQVISSLLSLQSKYVANEDAQALFQESQSRVKSMALVHEKLYESNDLARVDFDIYLRKLTTGLFRSFGATTERVALHIESTADPLDIDLAVPCGLIVNELVSNALKHAFPGEAAGTIHIGLNAQGRDRLKLIVSDDGIGFPKDLNFRDTESLGLQLVTSLVNQLDGTVDLSSEAGTEFTITFKAHSHETEVVS